MSVPSASYLMYLFLSNNLYSVIGFYPLCEIIYSSFDISWLVIKVPSTWEGLQACREFIYSCIKTFATTVFAMEQAVLAGEADCVSIFEFIHELKAILKKCKEAYTQLISFPIRYNDNESYTAYMLTPLNLGN